MKEARTITAPELRALGLAVFGHEWQTPLARALGVNPRTVRRWASGTVQVPARVETGIRRILGASKKGSPDWPRDEWIVQREDGGRMYIVHTRRPRFVARAVECSEQGEPIASELPADVLTGVVFISGDLVLCEIHWIDPPPAARQLTALMDAAADALEA